MKPKSGNPQHIPSGMSLEITKMFGVSRLGVYFEKYNTKCTYGFLRGQFEYRKCHPHVSWPGRAVIVNRERGLIQICTYLSMGHSSHSSWTTLKGPEIKLSLF